jgi:hypothetical protein
MKELQIAKEIVLNSLETNIFNCTSENVQYARKLIELFCRVYLDLISQSIYKT